MRRSIFVGIFSSYFWKQEGILGKNSQGANNHISEEIVKDVTVLWTTTFEPLLFGVIGLSLDFNLIQGTVLTSFLIVSIGLIFRLVAAFLVTRGSNGFTFNERVFIAIAWIPKATVQAAMCSVPLTLFKSKMKGEENYDQLLCWGNQILSTAILSICLTAPVGMLFVNHLGPRILECDKQQEQSTNNKMEKEESPRQRRNNVSADDFDRVLSHVHQLESAMQKLALLCEGPDVSCIVAEARMHLLNCKATIALEE